MVNLVYKKNDVSGIAGVITFAGDTPRIEFDTTGLVCVCSMICVEDGIEIPRSLIPGFDTLSANRAEAIERVRMTVSIYDFLEDNEEDCEEDYDELEWKCYLDSVVWSVRDVEEVKKETGLPYVFDKFNDAVFVKVSNFLYCGIEDTMSNLEKIERIDINFQNYVDGVTKLSK